MNKTFQKKNGRIAAWVLCVCLAFAVGFAGCFGVAVKRNARAEEAAPDAGTFAALASPLVLKFDSEDDWADNFTFKTKASSDRSQGVTTVTNEGDGSVRLTNTAEEKLATSDYRLLADGVAVEDMENYEVSLEFELHGGWLFIGGRSNAIGDGNSTHANGIGVRIERVDDKLVIHTEARHSGSGYPIDATGKNDGTAKANLIETESGVTAVKITARFLNNTVAYYVTPRIENEDGEYYMAGYTSKTNSSGQLRFANIKGSFGLVIMNEWRSGSDDKPYAKGDVTITGFTFKSLTDVVPFESDHTKLSKVTEMEAPGEIDELLDPYITVKKQYDGQTNCWIGDTVTVTLADYFGTNIDSKQMKYTSEGDIGTFSADNTTWSFTTAEAKKYDFKITASSDDYAGVAAQSLSFSVTAKTKPDDSGNGDGDKDKDDGNKDGEGGAGCGSTVSAGSAAVLGGLACLAVAVVARKKKTA